MSKYLVRMADENVARLAARNVAEDEYWQEHTNRRMWALAVLISECKDEIKLPGTYRDGDVYRTLFFNAPVAHRYKVVEIYCRLREEDIYSDAIDNGNPDLVREIKRVKNIVKLYIPHHSIDIINNTSRYTSRYLWVLGLVIVAVIMVGLSG